MYCLLVIRDPSQNDPACLPLRKGENFPASIISGGQLVPASSLCWNCSKSLNLNYVTDKEIDPTLIEVRRYLSIYFSGSWIGPINSNKSIVTQDFTAVVMATKMSRLQQRQNSDLCPPKAQAPLDYVSRIGLWCMVEMCWFYPVRGKW